jgi:hypothetical protein
MPGWIPAVEKFITADRISRKRDVGKQQGFCGGLLRKLSVVRSPHNPKRQVELAGYIAGRELSRGFFASPRMAKRSPSSRIPGKLATGQRVITVAWRCPSPDGPRPIGPPTEGLRLTNSKRL